MSSSRLLELPEAPLQHIIQLADNKDDLRLTCKQLLAAADRDVARLSLPPGPTAFSSAAKAAARWPRITELSLGNWTAVEARTRAENKQRAASLEQLRSLLTAAAQHWGQLSSLAFSLGSRFDHGSLEIVAGCLAGRLTSLTFGQSSCAHSNAGTARLLGAHFPQLTTLRWGCGAVGDEVFVQLGQLTQLQQLVLGGTNDPHGSTSYHYWDGSEGPNLEYCASMLPLSSLVALTRLELGDPDCITADGAGYLRNVTDVGMAVACLTALEDLSVQPEYLQEAAQLVFHMGSLTRLTSLRLGHWMHTRTMDGVYQMYDVDMLGHLAALRVLEVPGSMLQDEGVRALAECPMLDRLVVDMLAVTAESKDVVLRKLEFLSTVVCEEVDVSLASLMPRLRVLHCIGDQWPLHYLHSLHAHPTLAEPWLGWSLANPPQALTACLDSLPNFDLASFVQLQNTV